MTDSYVEHGKGGTMFVGPDAVRLVQALTLASALKLYALHKIIPTRGVTPTLMLAMASAVTGKRYKRGAYLTAAADVDKWAREMRDALPHLTEESR